MTHSYLNILLGLRVGRPDRATSVGSSLWRFAPMSVAVVLAAAPAGAQPTRVSAARIGTEVSGGAELSKPALSTNGRYVAFASDLSSLVAGDTNEVSDVFVRDLQTTQIVRVSVSSAGAQANAGSFHPSISGTGRYVVFESWATTLVAGDTNGASDIFLVDRDTDANGVFDEAGKTSTTRVNLGPGSVEATGGPSLWPTISSDGQVIAYISGATNLVAGDTNDLQDVFVRAAGATTRVSVATGGGQAACPTVTNTPCGSFNPPSLSSDGNLVVFESAATNLVGGDTNGFADIFLRNRLAGTTIKVSLQGAVQTNLGSRNPVISGDGKWIAYESYDNNFEGTALTIRDIILYNVTTPDNNVITRIGGLAPGNNSSILPSISTDGRYIAFESQASNLVAGDTNAVNDIFRYDRQTNSIVAVKAGGTTFGNDHSSWPSISGDGAFIAFNSMATNLVAGDTNGAIEPFVFNFTGSVVSRVAVQASGAGVERSSASGQASTSGDGRYVAFTSTSAALVAGDTNGVPDVYLFDRTANAMSRVSGAGGGDSPSIDAVGRFVAFHSQGNVYLRDRHAATTTLVSTSTTGGAANGLSGQPSISADGRFVAYMSSASNLVVGDSNGVADIFVFNRVTGTTTKVSQSTAGVAANNRSRWPSISSDGRYVAFESIANNLVASDTNGVADIFVRDRQANTTTRVSVSTAGAQGNLASYTPRVSANGQIVVFTSDATNLLAAGPGADINGKADVFARDIVANTTERVSLDVNGLGGTENSDAPSVSSNGRYVAFVSTASLVPTDTSLLRDIYVRDRQAGATARVSPSISGQPSNSSDAPAISGDGLYVAFESSANNLVATDPNKDVDVFLASRPVTPDADTTLPTDWKTQFGLVPGIDGANQDPDGDGRTNAQELADGTHPNATFARYLAEGTNSAFFETRFALLNPGSTTSNVLVRYQKSDGSTVPQVVAIPPLRRVTISTAATPGMANAEFSTVVETDTSVVVDRTMLWDRTHYGAHTETAVPAPSTTWYLAEGSTLASFQLFYLLQNPSATTDAQVRITYLLPNGTPLQKNYVVAKGSRQTVWVNQEDFSGQKPLAATDVSGVVQVTNGQPIVVERAMYLGTNPAFTAGHESAGVTSPATSWFLAEGATGDYFDLFVLLANPGSQAAQVRATYLLPGGATFTKDYTVAANSRQTIWVDEEVINGAKALANVAVSTTITSTNGVPIVVERAMWWPGPTSATWFEAHNSPGATSTGTLWALAEGEDAGADQTETYILIANTSSTAGTAQVTLLYEDGTSETQAIPLAANSRTNVVPRAQFPSSVGRRFGALVESLGATPASIVVERAMYMSTGGVRWSAGTNALGTKIR
ncbi:MAG: hypothetical protein U0Q12_04000 [Vicinamibacterales bacterium]